MHSLEAAIALVQLNSHAYEIEIPHDFCFGATVHGGFEASMIAKTVQHHFSTTLKKYDQPHSFNMHIMFLRPVTAGKAEMVVKDSKLGSGVSTTHVTLSQKAKELVVANTNMDDEHGVSYDTGYQLAPAAFPAAFAMLASDSDSGWAKWTFPWQAKASSKHVWLTPTSTDDVFTTENLGYIADVWPRMVESYCPNSERNTTNLVWRALSLRSRPASNVDTDVGLGRHPQAFWYPALSMTLEIKKLLPPQGVNWLFVRAQAKEISNGRMDTEVSFLDEKSELVALSHHVCNIIEKAHGPRKEGVSKDGKL